MYLQEVNGRPLKVVFGYNFEKFIETRLLTFFAKASNIERVGSQDRISFPG